MMTRNVEPLHPTKIEPKKNSLFDVPAGKSIILSIKLRDIENDFDLLQKCYKKLKYITVKTGKNKLLVSDIYGKEFL